MAEVRSGLRAVLSRALPYDLFQRAVGAEAIYRLFLDKADVESGQRVLDIGCGTAEVLPFLPDVAYVGLDRSATYVEAARRKHGDRGTFVCRRVDELSAETLGAFDRVLVMGVLHHLDDDDVIHLLQTARSVLAEGGRLTSFDPSYTEPQGRLQRLVLSLDRGQNVRFDGEYAALARSVFPRVEASVHHDLLRIPYTHVVLSCRG